MPEASTGGNAGLVGGHFRIVTSGPWGAPSRARYLRDVRIDRGFLGWGVFLLLAGAVPLAVRAGYVTTEQIRSLASLWPLILIGMGAGLLLARTRLASLGGLVVAGTFGLIVGGLLSGGVQGFAGPCGPTSGNTAFPARDGSFSQPSGTVRLQLDCGDVNVAVGPGDGWHVEGQSRDGTGPIVEAGSGSVSVRSRDSDVGPFDALGDRERWRVTLPDTVRLDLDLEVNAGSATMALGQAMVGRLKLDLNAGSISADLSSVRELDGLEIGLNAGALELTRPNLSTHGSIEANAGTVNLCVPPGAALRLRTGQSIISNYDYEGHGLIRNGSVWETPGFDGSAVQIELDTRANVGSFSLDPEGGCGD